MTVKKITRGRGQVLSRALKIACLLERNGELTVAATQQTIHDLCTRSCRRYLNSLVEAGVAVRVSENGKQPDRYQWVGWPSIVPHLPGASDA